MEALMLESALDMHDALLLNAPAGARHDADVCVFCTDFAMTDEGIPSGLARLELADAKSPYGSVTYADPGYQADKVKRYPIDTEAHARAAWSYIHQAKNAAAYSADQLSTMRTKIAAALKKFGVEAEKKANEANAPKTPAKPAAKKGEKAEVESPDLVTDDSSGTQSATGTTKPDAAVRGGTKHMETDTVEMISKETHEALLDKALKDGTAALTTERDDLAKQVTDLTAQLSAKTEELASATTENERINGELDTAQVALKAAQDEAEALKADAAAKAEEAAKAEIASARTAQVRNLSLFTEEFITERASRWAEMDEAAWTERLDEWKVAKGQTPGTSTTNSTTETASAITGTRDTQSGQQPSARRAALGLPAQ